MAKTKLATRPSREESKSEEGIVPNWKKIRIIAFTIYYNNNTTMLIVEM